MAIAKKKQKPTDGVIVTVYDFPIKLDTLYEVQEKLDSSAPDGFIEYRTTKVLNAQITDSYSGAVYDTERDIWDTGLYLNSRSFREAFGTNEGANTVLDQIQEHIVKPYEAEKGEGSLNYTQANNKFWDKFNIPIARGKVFDTSKVDDLLRLYLAVIHKRLTPKEHESNPIFKQPKSNYLIVDKEGAIGRQAETEMRRMEATATFYTMMGSNKDGLLQVLDYLGIAAGTNTDKATLVRVFTTWLDNKTDRYQNDKLFIEAVEEFNTEKGKDIFFIHSKLKELYRKGKVKFKKGEVYLDDIYVENGWKNSANKIQQDRELYELLSTMID